MQKERKPLADKENDLTIRSWLWSPTTLIATMMERRDEDGNGRGDRSSHIRRRKALLLDKQQREESRVWVCVGLPLSGISLLGYHQIYSRSDFLSHRVVHTIVSNVKVNTGRKPLRNEQDYQLTGWWQLGSVESCEHHDLDYDDVWSDFGPKTQLIVSVGEERGEKSVHPITSIRAVW